MSGNIVARRYAKALFAVGTKQGAAELETYGKQLGELAGALADSPEAMVDAERVPDEQTYLLVKDIAAKIESNMTYPGQIRVTVIREKRAVGYAK